MMTAQRHPGSALLNTDMTPKEWRINIDAPYGGVRCTSPPREALTGFPNASLDIFI